MRLSRLATLGLMLIALPCGAQAGAEKPVFATHTCSRPVPCEDRGELSSSQWAEYGKDCLTSEMGYQAANQVISDYLGLDTSRCLSSNLSAVPKGPGVVLLPKCCVVETAAGTCAFHCEISVQ